MLASDGVFAADGLRVLDLYAGSGALAFEAISRGATEAVLVEQARDATTVIRENARALGVDGAVRLLAARVERVLASSEGLGTFGLVLCDPPYADVRAPAFEGILASAAALLDEDGVLLLEHAATDRSPEVSGLLLDRGRRHGDTAVSLYRRAPR